jgi:hypothetical protein
MPDRKSPPCIAAAGFYNRSFLEVLGENGIFRAFRLNFSGRNVDIPIALGPSIGQRSDRSKHPTGRKNRPFGCRFEAASWNRTRV